MSAFSASPSTPLTGRSRPQLGLEAIADLESLQGGLVGSGAPGKVCGFPRRARPWMPALTTAPAGLLPAVYRWALDDSRLLREAYVRSFFT